MRRESGRALAAFDAACDFHGSMLQKITQNSSVDINSVRLTMRPVIDSILRNPNAMAWVIFSRKTTPEDYNRAVATAVWCVMFGRHLAFDRQRLEDLAVGGLLLDIGNLGLPESVRGAKGDLTHQQHMLQRKHVDIGVEILRASKGVPENVMDMVRCHQERADGSGYPAGLRGNATPSFGRIAAVADCYDAMTSAKTYSSASGGYDAARALNDMRGKEFQPEVVEQFLRAVGMFPTGSIVELNDGTAGVVLEQNPDNALRPKVLLLRDSSHEPLSSPRIKQLRDLPADATSRKALWIVNGHPHGTFGINPRKIFS
jgi:HD-GYP domain-containing protein (c-di-GMP phosphodiesterase class II)